MQKCLHGDLFVEFKEWQALSLQFRSDWLFSIVAYILVPHIRSATDWLVHISCTGSKRVRASERVSSCSWVFNLDVNILVWHHSCDNRCLSCQHFHFPSECESDTASHTCLGTSVNFSVLQQLHSEAGDLSCLLMNRMKRFNKDKLYIFHDEKFIELNSDFLKENMTDDEIKNDQTFSIQLSRDQ